MRETAYAKINLALHVRRRRGDGHHEIETLFAFVDAGDGLTARRSDRDELRVVGEFAQEITDPFGNLVSKALARLPRPDGLSIVRFVQSTIVQAFILGLVLASRYWSIGHKPWLVSLDKSVMAIRRRFPPCNPKIPSMPCYNSGGWATV
jgi:hypothetical protein